jgi:hypothetical protein
MTMKRDPNKNPADLKPAIADKDNPREYQLYPDSEDIYNKSTRVKFPDSEDIAKLKESGGNGVIASDITKKSNSDISGSDLDIPGTELDDGQEIIGSEDEENNYYSLGGDGHNDLDEDRDDM